MRGRGEHSPQLLIKKKLLTLINEFMKTLKTKNTFYLPSGRIFLLETKDKYLIECTEMRDVSIKGKEHYEVRSTLDPRLIWKHLKPYKEKWLLTVSTQKGCPHLCKFCDVGGLDFKGNLTCAEINAQIQYILNATPYVTESDKVKIGFARMGEPSHNLHTVLRVIRDLPKNTDKNFNWLPCFNSILPRKTIEGNTGFDVIDKVIETKERYYKGFLHFQLSINSTDEKKRKELFQGADVLTIEEIVNYINKKTITNRTVTLNFIVMKGVEIDIEKLVKMGLNKEKFMVKLIPLNNTIRKQTNNLETLANYDNYEELERIGKEFNSYGIPTVIDAIAKCEEAGLCCGQLAHIFMK